jgi:acetyl/propionyl-CoA carboxylase alpha subunit
MLKKILIANRGEIAAGAAAKPNRMACRARRGD